MMVSEEVSARYIDFFFRMTASEELINEIEETILQAIWDSQNEITEDEQVQLAIDIIWRNKLKLR